MPEPADRQNRDLILPPRTYAFVLGTTEGQVSVSVGPRASTLAPTDRPVNWVDGGFRETSDPSRAIQQFCRAAQGQYVVLTDPAVGGDEVFPDEGKVTPATQLDAGKRVVIPGPTTFAPWPGQSVEVIDGHRLRHNQYLVCRVYDVAAARENAARAQVESAGGDESPQAAITADLVMGQLFVIRGTDASFYVPQTGVEVVPESPGSFVREAATLEQLEYCVLLDESGSKRYERGPAVVFPEPTETFMTEKGERRFRAIELNRQSGLYVKVVEPYEHDGDRPVRVSRGGGWVDVAPGEEVKEGDEMFLTGEDTPIYVPRREQSVIHYGKQRKHHAIAVPVGEGRYVLDRERGGVDTVRGPTMLLPNPISKVVVRRVLDAKTVELWYPGNVEAAEVNARWRTELQGREADHLEVPEASLGEAGSLAASYAVSSSFAGEKMRRGTEYTPPRTITLDTKYQGPPGISIYSGYAVLVMNKSGGRRVEIGPKPLLLEYDETLMPLRFSTGRPKSDAKLLETVYLKRVNNSISDQVDVETKDLIPFRLVYALRVNFEGDPVKWFDVEDYVALLTDHVRSKLRNEAKRFGVLDFNDNVIDVVRDTLLGESAEGTRPGMAFKENGMRLHDVEVLDVEMVHPEVEDLLSGAQSRALRGAIALSEAEADSERFRRMQEIERADIDEREKTAERSAKASMTDTERSFALELKRIEGQRDSETSKAEVALLKREHAMAEANLELAIRRGADEADIARLKAEVDQAVRRVEAFDEATVTALSQFADQALVERLVSELGPVVRATGVDLPDVVRQFMGGTKLEDILDRLRERPSRALRP